MLDIEVLADEIVEFLKGKGAVRGTGEGDTPGAYVTVREICEKFDLSERDDWPKIKRFMLWSDKQQDTQKKYHVTYIQGRGHYVGGNGEEIMNVLYKRQMAEGWARHLPEYTKEIEEAAPEAKRWVTDYEAKKAEKEANKNARRFQGYINVREEFNVIQHR